MMNDVLRLRFTVLKRKLFDTYYHRLNAEQRRDLADH